MPPPPSTTPTTAATLRWALVVLTVQTAAVALLTAFLVYADLAGKASSTRGAALVTTYAAVMAVVMGGLTLALRRRQRWARGPAIVIELLLLPIGYTMATGGAAWLGIPVLALGLAGAAALLAPATRAALGMR